MPDLMKFEEAKRKFRTYVSQLYPGVDTIIMSDVDAQFDPAVRAQPQVTAVGRGRRAAAAADDEPAED